MKILITVIFIFNIIFSASVEEEKVQWQEGEKLTWAMFKGKPETIGSFVASTNSGISLSFDIRTNGDEVEINYTVSCYFYPNDSWYNKANVNATILAHEQTHFDISELFARKLRKKFEAIPKTVNFKDDAKVIYEKNEEDRVKMQDQFDLETNHSRLKLSEIEWEVYIEKQLALYNDWK
jgi:hypothetical protein